MMQGEVRKIKYENGVQVSDETVPQVVKEVYKKVVTPGVSIAELAKVYEPAPTNEAKREKFLRLASKRTQIVLDKIRILNNCAHRGQYDWLKEDATRMLNAIKEELPTLMGNVAKLDVPLVVDVGSGPNWEKAH